MTAAAVLSSETFDYQEYLSQFDERLLAEPEGRRVLTRLNPLLFALVYFRDSLRSEETGGVISFSQFHLDAFESAKRWARRRLGLAEVREGWIVPRGGGKSTLFKILIIWALAHGHRKFVALFSGSSGQAEQRMSSIRAEFDFRKNPLLYRDFPELCKPMKRRGGRAEADNLSQFISAGGSVITANGIDSMVLGANVNDQRPDALIFDDIERGESNYSMAQKLKLLRTVTQTCFNMNPNAVVQFVGTTTMHGSMMHDLVRSVVEDKEVEDWVIEEDIRTHYYPAIVTDDWGREASLWPQRWSYEWLDSRRHTRAFRIDYLNLPAGSDGGFWTPSDFRYDMPEVITRRILSIDPAVTSKSTSDFTGIAVVGYDPTAGRCGVELAEQVKLSPKDLRKHVLGILAEYPGIRAILIETNQGGDTWKDILDPLPVKILSVHQTEKKEVRAARVLGYYQDGWVAHSEELPAFEDQALAYPHVSHDDVIDAVCSGVHFFLKDRKRAVGSVARRQVRDSYHSYI